MKRFVSIIVFFLVALNSRSQKNQLNLILGAGPSFIFNGPANRYVDDFKKIGLNVLINKKGHRIIFNPGISYFINDYYTKLSYDGVVNVTQRAVGLDLDVLMRVSKKNYLRVGIFFNKMDHSSILISYDTYNGGYYAFGKSELYDGYSVPDFQAGVVAGMSFPFILFKKQMKLNVSIYQSGSRLVNYDYCLDDGPTGEKVKVLGEGSRPAKLLVALEINLLGLKKSKKEDKDDL
jgi:hypothetical protein